MAQIVVCVYNSSENVISALFCNPLNQKDHYFHDIDIIYCDGTAGGDTIFQPLMIFMSPEFLKANL